MELGQLRIGSYYNYSNEWNTFDIYGFFKLSLDHIQAQSFDIKQMSGILLTHEILLKMGFDYDNGWYSIMNGLYTFHYQSYDINLNFRNTEFSHRGNIISHKIKYVHEIQNIYYAHNHRELGFIL